MADSKDKKTKSILSADVSIGGISYSQKALFAKHLAVMLRSGLTVSESLSISQDSATGKFRKVIKNLSKIIKSGHSLSDALSRYNNIFPEDFVMAVYAGERSGTLIENLENIAVEMKKEKELVDKIRGATIYPIIVLIATVILGLMLSFFVLPKITPLFQGLSTDLPMTTEILIAFSDLVQDHGTVLFSTILVSILFLIWITKRTFMKPVTHAILLKTPIIDKIVLNANLSRFCRTLGTLLQSGLSITEAIEVTQKTMTNFYYRRAISKVARGIQKGNKLSDELESFPTLFPLVVTRMISVGEQSGNMDEALLYLSEFYESEVDNATKTLSTTIEPILLLIIGLVVGFLALSIITPIYDITGNVNR